ncbi:hypothetical protein ACIHAA_04225 [Streptomyces sp. NPDC052040]|uniref:hypothetical protein n=1 Tax=Streptomyces sp. NPDC052040 TaxID=3365682 RepID=UPI0037D288AA
MAAKIGIAVAETIVLRLAWQLWTAYTRHQHTGTTTRELAPVHLSTEPLSFLPGEEQCPLSS